MSEAPKEEAPKKKGGKLPIIIALVLMLGGGGFFMTKKKDKPKEPEIKLGKEEILLEDEFIVNMADGQTYVRAKIGLRAKEGFKADSVKAHDAEVSDAIVSILKTSKPADTLSAKGVKGLKLKIAAALNKIFLEDEKAAHGDEESDKDTKKKKKKKKKSDEHADEHASSSSHDEESSDEEEEEPEIPDGWDSAEGPILKVFFKALATQ